MQDSVTYQKIIAEGERKGRMEGLKEGRLEEARATLLRMGTRRFGVPDAAVCQRVEGVTDLERLERWIDRLLDAGDWDDLLADES